MDSNNNYIKMTHHVYTKIVILNIYNSSKSILLLYFSQIISSVNNVPFEPMLTEIVAARLFTHLYSAVKIYKCVNIFKLLIYKVF